MAESANGARLKSYWHGLSANHRGAAWMIAAAAGFTLNGALVKTLAAADMHPLQIAFARALVALLAILPFLWHAGPSLLRTRHPWIHLIRGLAGGGAMMCGFYALTVLPLAGVTALSFTTPLFTLLLAVLLLGELVGWRRWCATAVGFLGVLIMVRPGAGSAELGALFALAMAFGIALAVTLVKRLPGESRVAMLFWFCMTSIVISAVPAVVVWRAPSPAEWLLLGAIGLVGVSSQSLIIRAYQIGEASYVAPFDYTKLLLAGLIGYFVFAEVPDLWTLVGAAVIVASTLYIARREAVLGEPAPAPEPPT